MSKLLIPASQLIFPLFAASTLALAIVIFLRGQRAKRREVEIAMDNCKAQVGALGLADRDLELIHRSFLPALREAIKDTYQYSQWAFILAVIPILGGAVGSAIAVLASGIYSNYAVWGLALAGLIMLCLEALKLFNSYIQISHRQRTAVILRYSLERCLRELVAPTPGIPLDKQFAHFWSSFVNVQEIHHKATIEQIDNAQRASQLITDEAIAQLRQSDTDYRSKYQEPEPTAITPEFSPIPELTLELIPEVDDRFATVGMGAPATYVTAQDEAEVPTIGDTGLAVAQYIEMSQSGSDDDDTAVFLNQGGVG